MTAYRSDECPSSQKQVRARVVGDFERGTPPPPVQDLLQGPVSRPGTGMRRPHVPGPSSTAGHPGRRRRSRSGVAVHGSPAKRGHHRYRGRLPRRLRAADGFRWQPSRLVGAVVWGDGPVPSARPPRTGHPEPLVTAAPSRSVPTRTRSACAAGSAHPPLSRWCGGKAGRRGQVLIRDGRLPRLRAGVDPGFPMGRRKGRAGTAFPSHVRADRRRSLLLDERLRTNRVFAAWPSCSLRRVDAAFADDEEQSP